MCKVSSSLSYKFLERKLYYFDRTTAANTLYDTTYNLVTNQASFRCEMFYYGFKINNSVGFVLIANDSCQ